MKIPFTRLFLLFFTIGLFSFNQVNSQAPIETGQKIERSITLLKKFEGTYSFNEKIKVIVTLKNSKLFVEQIAQEKYPLVELKKISKNKFHVNGLDAEIRFKTNLKSNVVGLIYVREGQTMMAKKEKS